MKQNNVSIFIVSHKKYNFPKMEGYIPIQVGNGENLGILRDNTGDNISNKNQNYCELTALYWIWKNYKSDIIGITHYRRYFTKNIFSSRPISKENVEKYLEKYDIILPKPLCMLRLNVKQQYANSHYIKDLLLCGEIIQEKYPKYTNSFNKIMEKKYFYQYNMLITKKEIFDDYMEWLFEILFELEKKIDITNYSDYDKRVYGFLSERLFNVWLEEHDKLKIKELPIINIEEKKQLLHNIKDCIKELIIR